MADTNGKVSSNESSPKRTQTSEVINCCCSVARVRSACRTILNKDILNIRQEIADKTGKNGAVKWSSLTKSTQLFLNDVASKVKVKNGEKPPVPGTMNGKELTSLARSKSFKVSQFANVAITRSVDHVIQEIVRMSMITAKACGKNNILPIHIVNDTLKASNVFALIYNLEIIKTHESVLHAQEVERVQKITEKAAAKIATREQRKKDREEEKLNAKKQPKKSKVSAKEDDDDAENVKKPEKTKKSVKKKDTASSDAKPSTKKRAENKDGIGCEYMYYIDKIISVQKKELGEEYKNMRASAYMRNFCSSTISQLIARMTNMFSTLAKLGNMKTITDSIVITALNLILVDYRVEYPALTDAVIDSVDVYRKYRSSKEKITTDQTQETVEGVEDE